MSSGQVPGFLPSVNGLQFANSFPPGTNYPVITLPFGLPPITQDAAMGLCGGFVFTVMDMWLHLPRYPGSMAGTSTPSDPSPLFNYLAQRLLDSFGTNPLLGNGVKYIQWIQDPDTDQYVDLGPFGKDVYWPGLNDLVIKNEIPAIRANIDSGMPTPIGLVMAPKCDPFDAPGIVTALEHSHQVLAYAYEMDDSGMFTMYVYDPNQPDVDGVTVQVDTSVWNSSEDPNDPLVIDAQTILSAAAESSAVRGFFRIQYDQKDPTDALPTVVNPPQPESLNLVYSWQSDHGDDNPFNHHGIEAAGPMSQAIPLSALQLTNDGTASFDYAGGGYFTCSYEFDAAMQADGTIDVTLNGEIIDDGSHQVQTSGSTSFTVPPNQSAGFMLIMESTGFGYHNGPACLTGSATNSP